MSVRKINWPLWLGLLLTVFAFISYPVLFVWFPVTRDFPWANLLLFGIAVLLLVLGVRRANASEAPHPKRSEIVSIVVVVLCFAMIGLFVYGTFILARQLPASKGAPQVGQKAPDFTLPDINNKPVSLSALLATPVNGKPTRGVLLIFYRGYW